MTTPAVSVIPGAPEHVALIMDGNGRWATLRGLPRTAGHQAGARSVRAVVEAAPSLGIRVLTLYAFSADNWQRPPAEVRALMGLFRAALRREVADCVRHGVRLSVIGRRDRLGAPLVSAIERAEGLTEAGDRLRLRIAVDYSARDVITRAARLGGEDFAAALAAAQHDRAPTPAVDLLVRTGGEQRLSDFLLWECAYAELLFTPTLWPDFGGAELAEAVTEFRRRDRRFGRVALPASA